MKKIYDVLHSARSVPKYFSPKWFGAISWISEVNTHRFGNSVTIRFAALGVLITNVIILVHHIQPLKIKFVYKKTKNRINALSFYRSQNVLCQSKFFVSDQKFIYILCQSQTFCARQKDDLQSVKLVFVPAQKFLKRH